MVNLVIENVDQGSVILKNAQFRDELLTFTGAGTELEGTILARKSVNDVVVGAADGGNTGNGTITALSVAAGSVVPLVGIYLLTLVETITEGGVFELTDPNGAIVGSSLLLDPAGEATTIFEVAGLLFSVVDGSTDFVLADFFTLTVATNGKMVPFSITGAGGAQIPTEVLTADVTAAGAGDEFTRGMVSGEVKKERLIIKGSGAGVGITDAIIDNLRDFGIVAIDTQELALLDNQ